MSAFEELRRFYRDRDAAARAWKAAGGKVLGYVCETVPEELITAAGFLPYRVSGDPQVGQEAQDRYVHTLAPKGFSAGRYDAPGNITSICSMVLLGRYDFLDHLVLSNTRKSILMMQNQLRDAKAAYPELRIPDLYVLDRAQTPFFASTAFNRSRVLAFRDTLQRWSGKTLDARAISDAITQANETRALLRRVKALRSECRLSGVEALELYGASKLIPKADFNRLARTALAEVETRAPRTGPRLFAGGSPLDQTDFYAVLEANGATVVADDHAWGDRCAEDDLIAGADPIVALVQYYETNSPLIYPLSASVARTVRVASQARVDGAVLNVLHGDDIKLWEIPDEQVALSAAGIANLSLQQQPYRVADANTLSAQANQFIAGLAGTRA